jgi:hypothetical protein
MYHTPLLGIIQEKLDKYQNSNKTSKTYKNDNYLIKTSILQIISLRKDIKNKKEKITLQQFSLPIFLIQNKICNFIEL